MSHYAYGMGWASASSGPLDRFKMTVAEGGTRSPLIQDRGHDIGDVGEHADLARALDARPGESPFRGVHRKAEIALLGRLWRLAGAKEKPHRSRDGAQNRRELCYLSDPLQIFFRKPGVPVEDRLIQLLRGWRRSKRHGPGGRLGLFALTG